ncbi:MAG: hypothetical protein JW971_06275 [Synergistales bacterium]|nr:hypothetical protein [Synergistales bacterium]
MKLSEIFAPTSKNNPAKVKDPNLIRLIKAGYALYNSNDDELIFSTLGLMIERTVQEAAACMLTGQGARAISGSASKDTSFQVAVRVLKLSGQLPMTFMEKSGRTIFLHGFTDGEISREAEMRSYRSTMSNLLENYGIDGIHLENIQSGKQVSFLAVEGDKRTFCGTEGVGCTSCGWKGMESTPSMETFTCHEKEEDALEEVYTPGATTIPELCRQLEITPEQTMKTMFYASEDEEGPLFIAVLIRGDRQISLEKLSHHLGGIVIRRAEESELANLIGEVAGFCGPIGLPEEIVVVADKSVEGAKNLTVGANRKEYHIKGACWERDIRASSVADLASFGKNFPCPVCGAPLEQNFYRILSSFEPIHGVQENYSSLTYMDEERKKQVPCCWKGTLFIEPVMVTVFREEEKNLPEQLAPFRVHLVSSVSPLEPAFLKVENLYEELLERACTVLFEDRDVKMANKLYDADAMGMPWKIMAGPELEEGKAEFWSEERTGEMLLIPEILDCFKKKD